ncbi:MAG: IS110 family transposase, partial [Lachnospiraceae bacterium]
MNVKPRKVKKQVSVENPVINLLSKEEMSKKIEAIEQGLRSSTWRELETNGKFAKNDKLSFISDDMLIVGCDIGSETHYIRAIDVRGRELSKGAFEFSNTAEGFVSAKAWVLDLAANNDKKQIVLGLEPTG